MNNLFTNAWSNYVPIDFNSQLKYCYYYICANIDENIIGFVKVIWDGGKHGFLLDMTVHKEFRRQGIGSTLTTKAIEHAKEIGLEWLHVDYEPHLDKFYTDRGFRHTEAGLINLQKYDHKV